MSEVSDSLHPKSVLLKAVPTRSIEPHWRFSTDAERRATLEIQYRRGASSHIESSHIDPLEAVELRFRSTKAIGIPSRVSDGLESPLLHLQAGLFPNPPSRE